MVSVVPVPVPVPIAVPSILGCLGTRRRQRRRVHNLTSSNKPQKSSNMLGTGIAMCGRSADSNCVRKIYDRLGLAGAACALDGVQLRTVVKRNQHSSHSHFHFHFHPIDYVFHFAFIQCFPSHLGPGKWYRLTSTGKDAAALQFYCTAQKTPGKHQSTRQFSRRVTNACSGTIPTYASCQLINFSSPSPRLLTLVSRLRLLP